MLTPGLNPSILPLRHDDSRVWDVGMGQCLKTLFADGSPAVYVA